MVKTNLCIHSQEGKYASNKEATSKETITTTNSVKYKSRKLRDDSLKYLLCFV